MHELNESPTTTPAPARVTSSHPNRHRAALGVVAIAIMSALLSILAAPSASAAQGTRPCPSYYYCFYQDSNYNAWNGSTYLTAGWRLQYQSTTSGSFTNPPNSTTKRPDQLTSIINNTAKTLCLYDYRPNNAGVYAPLRVAPYQDYVDLSRNGWNDRADYWKVVTTTSCPTS